MKKTIKPGLLIVSFLFLISGCLSTSPVVQEADLQEIDGRNILPGFFAYSRTVSEYNEAGQLVREVVYYDKGTANISTAVYEYNQAGAVYKKLTYSAKHNLKEYEVYEFDAEGRRAGEKEYYADGTLKNYKTYEYNPAEATVIKRFFDPKGALYRYSVIKTDAAGNILEDADYRKP